MRTFEVSLQDGSLVITNKSNTKVTLRLVILHYQVVVLTVDEQRTTRTISEERKVQKELKPGEKIELNNILSELKIVSIIYSIDDKTFRDDIEL
ncbi:MAG: hypothetical protein JZD40_02215 [Sulfolobus sp.]|nr:hypothetical protein [Sulfolobus sp.]